MINPFLEEQVKTFRFQQSHVDRDGKNWVDTPTGLPGTPKENNSTFGSHDAATWLTLTFNSVKQALELQKVIQ